MSYITEVLADTPDGFYYLDDPSGTTATDYSGNANHGTYSGSPTLGLESPTISGPGSLSTSGSATMTSTSFTGGTAAARSFEIAAYSATAISSSSSAKYLVSATANTSWVCFGAAPGVSGTTEVVTVSAELLGAGDRTYWHGFTIPAGWHLYLFDFDGTQGGWTLYIDGVDVTSAPYSGTKANVSGGAAGWPTATYQIASNGAGTYSSWAGIGALSTSPAALGSTRAEDRYTAWLYPLSAEAAMESEFGLTLDAYIPTPAEATSVLPDIHGMGEAKLAAGSYIVTNIIPDLASAAVPLFTVLNGPDTGTPNVRVEVADVFGNTYATLDKAAVDETTWELNGVGTTKLTMSRSDPKLSEIIAPARELKVWFQRHLVWQGPIMRTDYDDQKVTVQAQDLGVYFTKRFFGKANRHNWIKNGSFEDGMAHWQGGWMPSETAAKRVGTFQVSTDRYITGKKCLYMFDPGTADQGIALHPETFLWKVEGDFYPKGLQWVVVAWVYIPGSQYVGPNPNGYGLVITRYSTVNTFTYTDGLGNPQVGFPVNGRASVPLSAEVPKDKWLRLEAVLDSPPTSDPELIDIQLFCPRGAMYVDNMQLTYNEQSSWYNTDQGVILKEIVEHAQDEQYYKSDLNIEYVGPTSTGIKRTRVYEHSEHQLISDAIGEFPMLHQGMDWAVEPTVSGPRRFVGYYPTKGVKRSDVRLRFDLNITDFTVDSDGTRFANSIVVLGEGEGSDREEGGAIDTTTIIDPRFTDTTVVKWNQNATYDEDQLVSYQGVTYYSKVANNKNNRPPDRNRWGIPGLTMEKVYHATPGTEIASLDEQAARGVNRFKRVLVIPNVSIDPSETIDDTNLVISLSVGDEIHVRFTANMSPHDGNPSLPNTNDDGVTGWYRVHKKTINWKNMKMSLELNPVSEEFI